MIKPESLMTVEDKGLPFHKNPYKFGNLFILFTINFPEQLNQIQQQKVQETFKTNKKDKYDEEMDAEKVTLIPFDDN